MAEIIVLGAGPAGISAALYACRAGASVTVLYRGIGALKNANEIENYYGFSAPVSGEALFEIGLEQVRRIGVRLVNAEVTGIDFGADSSFTIQTEREALTADALILALGAERKRPTILGLAELIGSGVSFCATCDGFFYRQKPVCVLGAGEFALHEARALAPLASGVTLLTNGEKAPECEFQVRTETIEALEGAPRLSGVRFADGSTLACDGLFVASGVAGASSFAAKLGIFTEGSFLKTDEKMQTNIPRLFACGDCTGTPFQIAKSVYEGMLAGENAVKALRV